MIFAKDFFSKYIIQDETIRKGITSKRNDEDNELFP